jgi:hypothetical protein
MGKRSQIENAERCTPAGGVPTVKVVDFIITASSVAGREVLAAASIMACEKVETFGGGWGARVPEAFSKEDSIRLGRGLLE